MPQYDPGSSTGILICLLLIVAIIVTLVALVMRNIALLLIITLLPLTLAGAAGPEVTRQWFTHAARMFVALLLAKPLIVVAVRLGAALVSVPRAGERQATFGDAMLGITIILLAGLLPGVIYRFSGGLMATSAGAPPRASGGVSAQSAQSVQSTADMTRMILDRNAPRPAVSGAGAGSTASVGRVGTASGSGLGAVAGPLGLAALGLSLAGGAVESGGRWMAGQAATGGGVLGDVEAPHVPNAPVSRMGQGAGRGGAPTAGGQADPGGRGFVPNVAPVQVTILHAESPARRTGPAVGGADSAPLIIPGTTVADHELERSEQPRALTTGKHADE